jgi:dTDP-4-amino-4,6-dideoxygalactose transaminase
MKIPFAPPFIDDDVIKEVTDTLKSGWITTGPMVKALEKEMSKISGVPNVLCVNSATSGLILSLKWFGIGEGDEVIVPSYTYCATALAVLYLGARPVMVDIKPDFTIDPEKVRDAITSKTKAVIPVDVAGWPANYESIYGVINDPLKKEIFTPNCINQEKLGRILMLSDAAHSIGALYKGKTTGCLCDITVFSFHAVKNITTAEGGAICLNLPEEFSNEESYAFFKLLSLNGQTKDAYSKMHYGGWRYDIVLPGFKMNMPDVCAAIGLAQIRKYSSVILPERKRVAIEYVAAFTNFEWAQLPPLKDRNTESSYHLFPLRIVGITDSQRDRIIEEISKSNIAVNVHFIPMPMLTLFKEQGYRIEDYPVAYDNYSREISLPIYPQLTNLQINYIVEKVAESYYSVVKRND